MNARRIGIVGVFVIAALALGAIFAGGASAASAAYSWGRNEYGESGNGSEELGSIPGQIGGLTEVTAIAGGPRHTLALLSGGTVEAWGANGDGQLGDGNRVASDTPVALSGLSEVTVIAAGGLHSLALLSNGTVEAWGDNNAGQLGDGGTKNSDVPVPVSGLSEVIAIAAGYSTSYALLSDGTVMAWGENGFGELGDGNKASSDVPVAVSGLSGVSAISAGGEFALALLGNGEVRSWGLDLHGQMGNGNHGPSELPEAVSNLHEVQAISAGDEHALALLNDGTVEAWGENAWGEVGNGEDGEGNDVNEPVAVRELSGVTAIAAGGKHSFALLSDGTVMAWGGDEGGDLGNGQSGQSHGEGLRFPLPVALACGLSGVSGIAADYAGGFAFGEISGDDCPVISEVSPDEGSSLGGTTVTIKGTNLSGATAVKFGEAGEPATSFTVDSPTEIKAVSPRGKGVRGISVTTPAGTSAPDPADQFKYVLQFGVAKLIPTYGPAIGGTTVYIKGYGFENVIAVSFGSTPATSYKVTTSETIRAVAPAGSGIEQVTVTTTSGTSEPSAGSGFDYLSGPEFGRCKEPPVYVGQFSKSTCTTVASEAKYEWFPVSMGEEPLQKRGITVAGGFRLETAEHHYVLCSHSTGSGEYTGGGSVALELRLTGCASSGVGTCTSAGDAEGEITLSALTGELGVTKGDKTDPAKDKVGMRLAPASGETVAEFTCHTTAETLRGSLVVEVSKANKMSTTLTWASKVSKGADKIKSFEGGAEATPQVKIGGGGYEGAGIELNAKQTSEEAIEVNTII